MKVAAWQRVFGVRRLLVTMQRDFMKPKLRCCFLCIVLFVIHSGARSTFTDMITRQWCLLAYIFKFFCTVLFLTKPNFFKMRVNPLTRVHNRIVQKLTCRGEF